jgi:hypothetical protein
LPPNPADKWPNNTNTPLPPNPADKWPKQTNTPLPPNPADKWSNNSKTVLPSNPANPQSSTKNGVSGSSGLGDKKSSPNQETAQGPYWQWRDNQIKAWNNELGKLDKKQDALGEKAGQKYWSPAARSEYQAAVAALDKDRAAINQKYNLNNEQYIKTNYPEYYARNYAGKGSSQSLTGIPSQPNVSSPLTTTSQATTTTSTKKPPFDSSIWSIEKSLQEGRSYNEAPWHNKLVRQWELDQNHPWNPITSQKDPAREAAEKAINDQYKADLELSKMKSLWYPDRDAQSLSRLKDEFGPYWDVNWVNVAASLLNPKTFLKVAPAAFLEMAGDIVSVLGHSSRQVGEDPWDKSPK